MVQAQGSGSGNADPLGFGPFTFTGSVTDTTMQGTFDFTNPGGGKGVATMTKVPTPIEPTSWGRVKKTYDD